MKTTQKTIRIYNAELTVKAGKDISLVEVTTEFVDTSAAIRKEIKAAYEKANPGKRVIDVEFILSEKSGLYEFPISAILPFGKKIAEIAEDDNEEGSEE